MHLLGKTLRWHMNGKPTHCAFDPCRLPFEHSCFHANDGRYYCDETCAAEAENHGFRRIEKLARQVN